MFTQPWLLVMPKRLCQNAPWMAKLSEKNIVHGTSSIEYAPSASVMPSIVAETCLDMMR